MGQKIFIKLVLIALAILVVLAGFLGWMILVKKSAQNPHPKQYNNNANLNLIYPIGGENFKPKQSLAITYKISNDLKNLVSTSKILPELYLLDNKNTLIGYIGKFDINNTQFFWDTRRFFKHGGYDVNVISTPLGQYRILILVRNPSPEGGCTAIVCDFPVETLDNPFITYSNGRLIYQYGNEEPIETQLIASDVSTSLFSIQPLSDQPLKILSPIGGNEYHEGDKIFIKWAPDYPAISTIVAVGPEGSTSTQLAYGVYGNIVYGDPNNTNGYFLYNNHLPLGVYRFRLTPANGDPDILSEPFNITTPQYFHSPSDSSFKWFRSSITNNEPGSPIGISAKIVESDGTPVSAERGFKIQGYISAGYADERSGNSKITDALYDENASVWEVYFEIPYSLFDINIILSCNDSSSICAQRYGTNYYVLKTSRFNVYLQ
ncbi:MAG: hypothetical protein Q8Q89_03410 [bacterium]|nr:hypothetical protein [bacterium]